MNYVSSCCHGLFFYIEEMAQWLEDNTDYEVYTLVSDDFQKHLCEIILSDRYTKYSRVITNNEFMENEDNFYVICNNYSHETLFKKAKNNKIKYKMASPQCKGLYIIYSANTFKYFEDNMALFKSVIPLFIKTRSLYNNNFRYTPSLIQGIEIVRGFYFNHYKPIEKCLHHVDKYFMYIAFDDKKNIRADYKKLNKKYKVSIYDNKYDVKTEDINKDWDDKWLESLILSRTNNPAIEYEGLIYNRYKDYMPRQPFEFWHYNKPVIFNDLSDGLLNIVGKLPLYTPVIESKFLKMDLTNLIEMIDRR